jgi:hypothetical protein
MKNANTTANTIMVIFGSIPNEAVTLVLFECSLLVLTRERDSTSLLVSLITSAYLLLLMKIKLKKSFFNLFKSKEIY